MNNVMQVVRKSATSQRFPDADWLSSIGFEVIELAKVTRARILIDDYDGTCGDARVDLTLSLHRSDQGEWLTDVISYNEKGDGESTVGLVGSWCKTRADVVRLCKALGVKVWRSN